MTASTDTKPAATKSSSRRALLAGAIGGIGAVAAGAMAKVSPVRAGVDGDVVLGATNNATAQTLISNSSADGNAFAGLATSGFGVAGLSSNNYGVVGSSGTSAGVYATSNSSTGLLGASGASPDAKPKTGVYGYANQDAGSRGVYGYSGKGHGVDGRAWGGVGVYAKAQTGYALRTSGRIAADKVSGVATIPAGSVSVTVSPGVNVTSGSFVLLTPQNRLYGRDLWYTTNPGADSITLHLSSSRSYASKIAWLLMG